MDVELVNDGPVHPDPRAMTPPPIVLASASPRRTALLDMLGLAHEVLHPNVDETLLGDESPAAHVERLARAKAAAGASQRPDALVIGADTVVVLDGDVLGKPARRQDAVATLLRLAGRDHVGCSRGWRSRPQRGEVHADVSSTRVWFRFVRRGARATYVSTGEPLDKAGSYGIQGSAPR